jgi:hypothetical protein
MHYAKISLYKDVPEELVGYVKTKINIERIIINPAYTAAVKARGLYYCTHGWIKTRTGHCVCFLPDRDHVYGERDNNTTYSEGL